MSEAGAVRQGPNARGAGCSHHGAATVVVLVANALILARVDPKLLILSRATWEGDALQEAWWGSEMGCRRDRQRSRPWLTTGDAAWWALVAWRSAQPCTAAAESTRRLERGGPRTLMKNACCSPPLKSTRTDSAALSTQALTRYLWRRTGRDTPACGFNQRAAAAMPPWPAVGMPAVAEPESSKKGFKDATAAHLKPCGCSTMKYGIKKSHSIS